MIAGWVIGVLLSMAGSVIDNIGITMQKYSHLKNSWLPKAKRIMYYKQKTWWAGFLTFILGNLINVVGLGFTTQVLFAAIGGVSLVANAVNSHFFLGEPFNRRMFIGTIIIIGGSSLAVNFGSHAHEDFDLHDLEHFFDLSFIVYGSIVLSMLVVLLLSIHFVKFFAPQDDGSMGLDDEILHVIILSRQVSAANSDEALLPSNIGSSEQPGSHERPVEFVRKPTPPSPLSQYHRTPSQPDNINIRVTNIESVKHYQDQEIGSAAPSEVHDETDAENDRLLGRHQFLSFAYPSFSGLIGSFTVLLAKCTAELVRVSLHGQNQFDSPVPFLMVVGTLMCGAVQVHYIQLGLRSYDQLVVISVYYVVYTTFSIFGGVFYFNEFHSFSIAQVIVFPLATVFTFFGVYLISTNPESYKAQEMRMGASRNMDSDESIALGSPHEQSVLSSTQYSGYNSLDHVEHSDELLYLHCIRCGTPHSLPAGTQEFVCSWCSHPNKQLSGCTVL